MNDDLDRVIDAAARTMVSREPSRQLSYRVMSRVRAGSQLPRRRVWMLAVSGTAVACVAALWVHNRSAAPTDEGIALLQARSFLQQLAPPPVLDAASPPRIIQSGSVKTPRALESEVEPAPLVEPLHIETLAMSAIDVPAIEPMPTAVEAIELATLTIEPLATSNE
jgi:hypothetical protein